MSWLALSPTFSLENAGDPTAVCCFEKLYPRRVRLPRRSLDKQPKASLAHEAVS